MRTRIAVSVVVIQSILFFAHWLLYRTWIVFMGRPRPAGLLGFRIGLILLSVLFVAGSFLAIRYSHLAVRLLYRLGAVWMGFLNFIFPACILCWIAFFMFAIFGVPVGRRMIGATLFGLAILVSFYGFLNANSIRLRRLTVELPGLPESWQDRVAALVSDTHLGHVHGRRFTRRVVSMLQQQNPDVVFIAGDLYDGTMMDAAAAAEPWKKITPAFGIYFVTGNHEEFSSPRKYIDAVRGACIRVLNNEMTLVDGLQIMGVHYGDSTRPDRFRSILERAGLDRTRASILLCHAPHALPIAEEAGISLQLSGHTHGGQVIPFTWVTRRIFGKFTYGLQRFGRLLVYTSYGAGTWGPPMRVGTRPEIVLIRLKCGVPA